MNFFLRKFTAVLLLSIIAVASTMLMWFVCPVYAESEKDITAINEIGLLYYNSGNYQEAINEFQKILRIKPDHDVAHFNLGCVYQKMKQHKAGLREFQSVLDLLPGDRESMDKINTIAKKWIQELKMDLEANPAEPKLLCDIGLAYLYIEQMDEAYENISASLKVNPKHAEAHYNLSQYYLKKSSYEQALEPAKMAAKLKSNNALYTKNYRKIAQFLGKSTKIEKNSVPKLLDSNVDELLKKGKEYFDEGENDQAAACFRKVLSADKKNKIAHEYLLKIKELNKNSSEVRDAFHEGEKHFKREAWNKAVVELNKIIKLDTERKSPYYLESLKMLSESYIQMNNPDQAEPILKELELENPSDFRVLYNLGVIFHLRGNSNRAIEYFKKAKLSPDVDDKTVANINDALAEYQWSNKAPYVYGGIAILLLLVISGLTLWNMPSAKKKRMFKTIDDNFSSSQYKNVIQTSTKLSSFNLEKTEFIRYFNLIARSYLATDNTDQAIKTAKRVLMKDINDETAHEILGKSYFKNRIINTEAILEYKRLLQADKGNMEILKLIGNYYVKNQKDNKLSRGDTIPDYLLEMFKDFLSKDSTDRELLHFIANLLRKRKDTSPGAAALYQISLEFKPENYRMREVLAKTLFEKKEYEAAIEECIQIFKENIGNTQTHRIFIDSNMALDRYDNVIMEYEKLNIAYPDNADIERRLTELKRQGISIEGGGKRHGSVEANYGVCLDKGAELFARGEFNKAIAELRLAKKDDKFSRNASVLLVKCYLRKDLIDLAREEYAELQIEGEFISGDLKDVTYDLARVLEEKGQFNDALKLYDLICKVDIGFKDVFDKFEELHDYVKRF